MNELHDQIRYCRKCHLFRQLPNTMCPVPGVGNQQAKLMIVGEALGENEALMQEPFVGFAGQLLDKIMEEAGIVREDCYITNVVKCRPTVDNKGMKNRAPDKDEIAACKNWLWQEIQFVKPKFVLLLGKIPTKTLLHKILKSTFKLGDVFGKFHVVDYCDSVMIPCYHPSYLMQHGKDKIEITTELFKDIKRLLDEL